ncbi:uncharacterized protein LOC113562350 isoform X3 [Ooceraea biroi]|nr:uncharacterized protein LOC113562350 isoform X3 [Ooceraea biroi]XP_026827422.1 uncharacterized protein LOC113562350 isoform X3 [Ooceraea biroi]XP_026827423.1 uncharacterized protein LOC113562350 isoform X3 [Ooceraea biroi]
MNPSHGTKCDTKCRSKNVLRSNRKCTCIQKKKTSVILNIHCTTHLRATLQALHWSLKKLCSNMQFQRLYYVIKCRFKIQTDLKMYNEESKI